MLQPHRFIDLNCDMGEGIGNDAAVMPYLSSANIACGGHAGDEETMQATIALALNYGVAIGAHPSYPDRANFGRTDMDLPLPEVYALVKTQVLLLMNLAEKAGTSLHHVKPHGALYNKASKSAELAATIAQAVKDCGLHLVLYGLSGSHLITEAQKVGLKTASEVFADRTYVANGNLTPRSAPGALITTEALACEQVLQMIQHNTVRSLSGKEIPVVADTICIHGDGGQAAVFAEAIHLLLKNR